MQQTEPVVKPEDLADFQVVAGFHVNQVVDAFEKAGHPNPEQWIGFMEPGSANHTSSKLQRFAINSAFRLILGNYRVKSTIDARYCLMEECGAEDWLRAVNDGVVSFMVKNQILY